MPRHGKSTGVACGGVVTQVSGEGVRQAMTVQCLLQRGGTHSMSRRVSHGSSTCLWRIHSMQRLYSRSNVVISSDAVEVESCDRRGCHACPTSKSAGIPEVCAPAMSRAAQARRRLPLSQQVVAQVEKVRRGEGGRQVRRARPPAAGDGRGELTTTR